MRSVVILLCAWVLWADMGSLDGGWGPIRAHPGQADCESYRERYVSALKTNGFRPVVNDAPFPLRQDKVYFMQLLCLPDTVDPRGPRR